MNFRSFNSKTIAIYGMFFTGFLIVLYGIMFLIELKFVPYNAAELTESAGEMILHKQFHSEKIYNPDNGPIASLPQYNEIVINLGFPDKLTVKENNQFKINVSSKGYMLPGGERKLTARTQKGVLLYNDRGEMQEEIKYHFFSDFDCFEYEFEWSAFPESTGNFRFWVNDLIIPVGKHYESNSLVRLFPDREYIRQGFMISDEGILTGSLAFEKRVYTKMGISERNWEWIKFLLPLIIAIIVALIGVPFIQNHFQNKRSNPSDQM